MIHKEYQVQGSDTAAPLRNIKIYTVDSYAHGIAFGENKTLYDIPVLHLGDEGELAQGPQLRSRYILERNTKPRELEYQLRKLQRQGELSASVICFGVSTDPFFPFEGKFDVSIKALELFAEYTPGKLIVQTRSPLIVLAMPVLKSLGERLIVTVPVESHRQDLLDAYSPALPRIEDRLGAIRALRACGVKVCIQAAPILPYGDWRNDVEEYAKLIAQNADYIKIKSLWNGSKTHERAVRLSSVGKKLVESRQFFYLRADSAKPLEDAIRSICPQKLELPELPAPPEQIALPL